MESLSTCLKQICEWLCKPLQHKLNLSPQFLRLEFMTISKENISIKDALKRNSQRKLYSIALELSCQIIFRVGHIFESTRHSS